MKEYTDFNEWSHDLPEDSKAVAEVDGTITVWYEDQGNIAVWEPSSGWSHLKDPGQGWINV